MRFNTLTVVRAKIVVNQVEKHREQKANCIDGSNFRTYEKKIELKLENSQNLESIHI